MENSLTAKLFSSVILSYQLISKYDLFTVDCASDFLPRSYLEDRRSRCVVSLVHATVSAEIVQTSLLLETLNSGITTSSTPPNNMSF